MLLPDLLGRAAQSMPRSRPRRAEGAGLDGEGTDRAILYPPPDGRLHILSAVSAILSGRDPSLKSTMGP